MNDDVVGKSAQLNQNCDYYIIYDFLKCLIFFTQTLYAKPSTCDFDCSLKNVFIKRIWKIFSQIKLEK